MRRNLREKGISLVALVVTIIVLLILAGITINGVLSDNGLIQRATGAANQMEKAFDAESKQMENWKKTLERVGSGDYEILPEYTGIYATLYTDGTLGFSNNRDLISGKTAKYDTWEYTEEQIQNGFTWGRQPWYEYVNEIETVDFVNKIVPGSLRNWFCNCRNLVSISNMEMNLDTIRVTSMEGLFDDCSSLASVNLSNFNTKKVTDMRCMFSCCMSLTSLDLSSFNTQKVKSLVDTFYHCEKITSLNLSNFDTSQVEKMGYTFCGCDALNTLDLSSFDTSNVTDMNNMFSLCENLESVNVTSFNTSKVENMSHMFWGCDKLPSIDLSSFDTTSVTDISSMFNNTLALKSIYVNKEKWKPENVANCDNILKESGTNIYINRSDKTLFGYNATNGWGWSGTPRSRTANGARASNTVAIKIDSTKTYRLTSTYAYFGYSDMNVTFDSGWKAPGIANVTGLTELCVNFKKPDNTNITDDDLVNILSNFKIEEL